ncbi:MAG: DUF2752 domain-containing protein [Ruminococcaceae bacterium]|nr:DUF2752 domain-containing protein [Oscillospiraceae bacterium]
MQKTVKKHLVYLLALSLIVLLITGLKIGCPILYVFKIPCPCCGITRALISFCKGDWNGYLHYHALALPLLGAIWMLLHKKLFNKQVLLSVFSFTVLLCNFLYYIYRLLQFLSR